MEPAHQEVDARIPDEVDQPMLLGDPSGPDVGPEVAKRFGFPDPLEGVSEHGLNELENAEGRLSIGIDPEAEVFSEFGLEYRQPGVRGWISLPFLRGQLRS